MQYIVRFRERQQNSLQEYGGDLHPPRRLMKSLLRDPFIRNNNCLGIRVEIGR
jgi:hypothetical protein